MANDDVRRRRARLVIAGVGLVFFVAAVLFPRFEAQPGGTGPWRSTGRAWILSEPVEPTARIDWMTFWIIPVLALLLTAYNLRRARG